MLEIRDKITTNFSFKQIKIMKKIYYVTFDKYKNLTATFASKKAAMIYLNKIWETFGMSVYLDGELNFTEK